MATATQTPAAAADEKELLISGSEAVAEALTLADIDAIPLGVGGAAITYELLTPLPPVSVPLVICAEDDAVTPFYFSRELARRIPNALLRALGTGGHMCMLTMPEPYAALVLDFLATYDRQI